MDTALPEETPPATVKIESRSWDVVRETWLSRKPHKHAGIITAWSLFLVIMGSAVYWRDWFQSSQWMIASGEAIFGKHEYWRLWTSLFAHADMGHLASNSLLFFVFGYFLNGYFGAGVFPLLAIALGGLTNAITIMQYDPSMRLLGISGVVYWMGGFWLVLYLMLDKQRTYLQRSLRSMGVALGVFMPAAAFDPQISYQAHLWGFAIGILSGLVFYYFKRRTFARAVVVERVTEVYRDEAPANELPLRNVHFL
jgi:Uncharacterized membrane protein (homolog of Drosophila rhomboid)